MPDPLPPLSLLRSLFNSVRETVAKRPIGVNASSPEGILDSGRFRSAFDRKSASYRSPEELDTRSATEEALFGFPEDTRPLRRPIYGALRGIGPTSRRGDLVPMNYIGPPAARGFGDWLYLLSPEAKARSTVFFGDSYGQHMFDSARAYELSEPLPPTALRDIISQRPQLPFEREPIPLSLDKVRDFIENMNPNLALHYLETQTAGPVRLNDVSSIIYPTAKSPKAEDRLNTILRRYRSEAPSIPLYPERRVLEDDDLARHLQLKYRGGLVSALRGR